MIVSRDNSVYLMSQPQSVTEIPLDKETDIQPLQGQIRAGTIASSWVGQRAGTSKALGASLYLSSYYLGSSLVGSVSGLFWRYKIRFRNDKQNFLRPRQILAVGYR